MSNFSCLSSYFYLGAPRDANISASRGEMRRLPGELPLKRGFSTLLWANQARGCSASYSAPHTFHRYAFIVRLPMEE